MSRALHEHDICELVPDSLTTEIERYLTGPDCALIAVEDKRLQPLIPINGQASLFDSQITVNDGTVVYEAPLPSSRTNNEMEDLPDEQAQLLNGSASTRSPTSRVETDSDSEIPHFPRHKKQRFHFETNSFNTVVTLFPKCGYFQRGAPFMDMTRIVRPGGKIIAVTGLQPEKPSDHDAKWWVPNSDDAELESIRILRHEEFQTPHLVSVFTVTSSSPRHPDAEIVTKPKQPVVADGGSWVNLTDYTNTNSIPDTTESETGHGTTPTASLDDFRDQEHEQNDNWEWSDAFTEYVHSSVDGLSLKICPGLRPICDVNLDLKNLNDVANSENAAFDVTSIDDRDERLETIREAIVDDSGDDIIYGKVSASDERDTGLYDGYACKGDMFELPFETSTFDTVVADPPWLALSASERYAIFTEAVRVTKPTGNILYNATWIPEADDTRRFDLRFRQQLDFWGGPSFIASYCRTARDIPELFDAHNYDSEERYPADSSFWSEAYDPNALSTTHNTDPKKVSAHPDYHAYCCPMCGCAHLGQIRTEYFESKNGEYNTYQCHNCAFRGHADEIDALADELTRVAEQRGIPVSDVEHLSYTPPSVQRALDDQSMQERETRAGGLPDPNLPWVPDPDQQRTAFNSTRAGSAAQTCVPAEPDNTTTQLTLTSYDESNSQQSAHSS